MTTNFKKISSDRGEPNPHSATWGVKAARGLAIIAAIFTLTSVIRLNILDYHLSNPTISTRTDSGDCGYQMVVDGKVLGTVFLDEPTTIEKISETLGKNGATGIHVEKVVPCGSVIIFDRDGRLLEVQRLAGAQIVACGKRIDLKSATGEDMRSVPGIGPGLARRIEEHTEAFGPFESVDDLVKVKGIGPRKAQELKLYLK
ncbi:MAG: ComEA family DNA-binding protein [Desulfomonilaceae bacterium]